MGSPLRQTRPQIGQRSRFDTCDTSGEFFNIIFMFTSKMFMIVHVFPMQVSEKEREFTGELNPDVVIQIFSPIITSQRIMGCQFGNSYVSVQCRDGTNIVFDEVF